MFLSYNQSYSFFLVAKTNVVHQNIVLTLAKSSLLHISSVICMLMKELCELTFKRFEILRTITYFRTS